MQPQQLGMRHTDQIAQPVDADAFGVFSIHHKLLAVHHAYHFVDAAGAGVAALLEALHQRVSRNQCGTADNCCGAERTNRGNKRRRKETLPASLVFSVVPYEGLSVRNITLRVSVITSGAQPMLKLRWIGEEVQREEIAQGFKTVLQEKIGNAAPLSLGAFDPK